MAEQMSEIDKEKKRAEYLNQQSLQQNLAFDELNKKLHQLDIIAKSQKTRARTQNRDKEEADHEQEPPPEEKKEEKKDQTYKQQKKRYVSQKHVDKLVNLLQKQPEMYYFEPATPISEDQIAKYTNYIHQQMKTVNVNNLTSFALKMKKLLPMLIVITQRALEMQERVKNGQLGAGNYSMTVVNHRNRYPQLEEL
eukprot:50059_1